MTHNNNAGPFGFKYWPFSIVPEPGQELVWADRSNLKRQVTRLGRTLGKHDAVSLHLLWADFGAGKTHTLLYIKQEADKGDYGSLLPLYSALPKGCRSFLDIYRAIVRAIPPPLLRDAYQQAVTEIGREVLAITLSTIWPTLSSCFSAIGIGSETQQNLALAWLRAEAGIPMRQVQELSLLGRIRSTDEAVLALFGIVRLFNLAGRKRVLMMVDEFQRVEVLRRQQQDDINAGLHGFFNTCGRGMSLLLSFSFGVEENIRHFLNAELLSRVHPLRIAIPALTKDEGVIFLSDVVRQARQDKDNWPVSEDVIPKIVESVADKFRLTPRRLLKAAGAVFESAALDLEDETISQLDASYVIEIANQDGFSQIDEGDE
jgi:hypothetical protein